MTIFEVSPAVIRFRPKHLTLILLVTALYFAAAHASLFLAFEQTNASPVWPPSGIAFAAVLLLGIRVWPGILLGAFFANFYSFEAAGVAVMPHGFGKSLFIAIGNSLEAIVGARLLRHWQRPGSVPRDIQGVLVFIAVAGIMSLVSSVIGSASLLAAGTIQPGMVPKVWFTWWVGDATGILTVTPLILAWVSAWRLGADRLPGRFALGIQLATFAVSACIFWECLGSEPFASLPYLVVPPVLWAAYRGGMRGATLGVLIISMVSVTGTIHGMGPFATGDAHISLVLLQTFILVIAITVLVLAASIEERNRWEQRLLENNVALEQRVARRTEELRTYQGQLENLVAERTRELEASNRDLESFSYSISHDLRTPLRGIDGFSHMLVEDYAEQLPEEAHEYLRRIRASAQRMGELIDALLQLSRVGRATLEREDTDLSALSREIIRELQQGHPGRTVRFNVEDGLHADADPRLIRLVLQNLIGNAWKYTAERDDAEIHIGVEVQDGTPVFHVSDNGTGFDMRYADKLFAPFERLHDDRFEGTGIGLATVARIIQRHGGRVWATSDVDRGATFHFTTGEGEAT